MSENESPATYTYVLNVILRMYVTIYMESLFKISVFLFLHASNFFNLHTFRFLPAIFFEEISLEKHLQIALKYILSVYNIYL